MDVSNGTNELESGVVPRYLIMKRGFPAENHPSFFEVDDRDEGLDDDGERLRSWDPNEGVSDSD